MLLTFGKYKNETIKEIFSKDKQYINWLYSQSWFKKNHNELYHYSKKMIENHNPTINKDKFILYTDGACSHNGDPKARSSIGIHFSEKNPIKIPDISEKIISDFHSNNVAELKAIKKSFELMKNNNVNIPIQLYTDSCYCRLILIEWYEKWIRLDKLKGKKNIDIIKETYDIYKTFDNIDIIYVRAHSNKNDEHSYGNRVADQLARDALK